MDTTNQVWRIRSAKTGLFSCGAHEPKFSKRGKIWKQMNHLTSHLLQLSSEGKKLYQANEAEIVSYKLEEVETDAISIDDKLKLINQEIELKQEMIRQRNEQLALESVIGQ
jgi:hypothetical protein